MKDRRESGLCYYCDSKWDPSHKCQNPRLYILEEVLEDNEVEEKKGQIIGDKETDSESRDFISITENPEISLHAIIGSHNPWTMRLKAKVVSQWVIILTDAGSTQFCGPCFNKEGGSYPSILIKGSRSEWPVGRNYPVKGKVWVSGSTFNG